MLRALYSSATGMETQQTNLDIIANNLANVNTTGFKKYKVEFQDLLYETKKSAGADQGSGNQVPTGVQIGHGAQVASTSKIFTQGELTQTGSQLDLAIQGDGFFEVQMPDGTLAFTRDGGFKVDSQGRVVTGGGMVVQGGFQPIPAGTTAVNVSTNGQVTLTGANGNTSFRIQVVRFTNPGGLDSLGQNLYRQTTASGQPEMGNPGENSFGQIQQGYLEMSNVKVVEEMVNLIMAQRAYEVNAKSVQAADEMMQMSNNLRR
jgi:flagellar basal-body rod protein FlgG